MNMEPSIVLIIPSSLDAYLVTEVHAMYFSSVIDEGPIEEVTIETRVYERLHLSTVREEFGQQGCLIRFVKDGEESFILWSW